jgi:hypothetical protein
VVAAGGGGRFRHRQPAGTDAEVERRVQFAVIEFHQHVGAADADLRRTMGDEGGDVEGPDADHVEPRVGAFEAQAPAVLVDQVLRRGDAGAGEDRAELGQDAALGDGEDQRAGIRRRHRLWVGNRQVHGNA